MFDRRREEIVRLVAAYANAAQCALAPELQRLFQQLPPQRRVTILDGAAQTAMKRFEAVNLLTPVSRPGRKDIIRGHVFLAWTSYFVKELEKDFRI